MFFELFLYCWQGTLVLARRVPFKPALCSFLTAQEAQISELCDGISKRMDGEG